VYSSSGKLLNLETSLSASGVVPTKYPPGTSLLVTFERKFLTVYRDPQA
jgi:hypothetical protein